MKVNRFEAAGLKCIEVAPDDAAGRDLPLFIALHGRGDRAESYIDLAPAINASEYRFVFPNAPLAVPGAYYEWFRIDNPNRVQASKESTATVTKLITQLCERFQTPANRTVLGGFSQGGMLTFQVGLRYPEKLAGLAVLSGVLLADFALSFQPSRFADYYNQDQGDLKAVLAEIAARQTPIFIAHGTYDPVLPVVAGRAANRLLKEAGANVEYYEFHGGHEISLDELEKLQTFLIKVIS
jgi:phospholipase/carboxylesterase